MSNNTSKRQTIFIDKSFQGRTILSVFLLIALSGICSALLVYWLTGGELQAQSQTAHLSIVNTLEHLGISILIANVVAILVAGSMAVFVVLYASHKIAGPLYRFEKLCEQIGDGHLEMITSLREHDQLQELGTAFSEMVTKLRSRKDKQEELVTKLASHLEALQQDPDVSTQHSEQLKQMRHTLIQLLD
jgi:nitrogen fixation/metabolism regulation signal transduction histidine kinase